MLDYLSKKFVNKVDDFVLIKTEEDVSHLKFSENKIVQTGTEALEAVSIFVAKDKKIISTSLNNLNEKSADKIVTEVLEFLKFTKPNENYYGIAKGPFNYKKVSNGYDKKIKDIDEVDIVESGINAALENAKRTNGIFESSTGKTSILTSGGVDVSEEFSSLYFSLRALMDGEASGHKTSSSRVLNNFKVEEASRKAGEIAKDSLNPEVGRAGEYDLIIDPLPMADLMGTVGSAASVYEVDSGMSFFEGKIGKKIGNFDLIDNGRLDGGMASSSFDAEGVPTQRTKLIENGILKTYLHNTSTAKKYNVKSTGNAGLISPDPSNLIFDGSKGNVFDVKKGIYVTNIWYTRFQNYSTGDFSTIPRDGMFLVENGEIVKPIKNLRISDNLLRVLSNVKMFDNNVEQITSWEANTPVTTSNVLIEKVKFSKPLG